MHRKIEHHYSIPQNVPLNYALRIMAQRMGNYNLAPRGNHLEGALHGNTYRIRGVPSLSPREVFRIRAETIVRDSKNHTHLEVSRFFELCREISDSFS